MDHQIILNKNNMMIIDMVTNSEYLFKKYHNLKSIEAIEITKICEGLEDLSLEQLEEKQKKILEQYDLIVNEKEPDDKRK